MKLSQKIHSIWEGRNSFKKSRLFISLTAMGILGGFFVMQAVALNSITVTNPTAGSVMGGSQLVTWSGDCEAGDTVNIYYSADEFNNSVKIGSNIACSPSEFAWNTTALNGTYKVRIKDASDDDVRGTTGSFIIDNIAPAITTATLSSPNGGELWGGTTQNITWSQAEITDANLGATSISLAYSTNGGTDWIDIATGEANDGTYLWALPSVNSEAVKVKITATDLAGNKTSDESNAVFKIDKTKPVGAVSLDKATASELDSIRLVTVSYDEVMNTGVNPTISFISGTWVAGTGSWTTNQKWEQSFTLTDNNEEFATNLGVSGAKDVAGNEQDLGVVTSAIAIDTKSPTVSNVTIASPVKAGLVNMSIEFSEGLNVMPTVEVTGLGDAIAVNENVYAGKTWTGSFTVPGAVGTVNATVSVKGAKDALLNVMADNLTAKTFVVDTDKPTGSVTLGKTQISDSSLTQTITVVYGESMDVSANPSVSFDASSGTWSTGSQNWNSDGKTWVGTFTLSDANANAISGAIVSGAKDVAGNLQENLVSADFSIDTKNPTVVLDDGVTADYIVKGGEIISFTATFSEIVTEAKISIDTIGADDIDNIGMTIGAGGTTAAYIWTVPAGNDGEAVVSISAKDNAGNVNTPATGETVYTIDNVVPKVTVNNLITNDTTPTISGTMDDPGATVTVVVNLVEYPTQKNAEGDAWTAEITTPLLGGIYDVAATITDVVVNTGHDTTTNELTIDTVAPSVPVITSPTADAVYKIGVPLTFTATDLATAVTCSYQVDSDAIVDNVPCTNDGATPNVTINSLSDGRHSIVVTATDAATNSSSSSAISFIVDTNNTLTVAASGADFTTIQGAIDAATAADIISILPGTYSENVTVNKGVKIESSGDASATNVIGGFSVVSGGVTIDGVSVTNPTGSFGLLISNGAGDISIINNIFAGIGSDLTAQSAQGVYVSGAISNVTISGNNISNIGSVGALYSTKGIYIGDTSKTGIITGLMISNNTISNINAPLANKGAYGIEINFGGSTEGAQITGNTISGLTGKWSTAIGLERNTPNANVANNTISGLTGVAGVVGVMVEDNPSADTVKINENSFDAAIYGVANKMTTGTVNAEKNWWGTPVKSLIKVGGLIDFDPWYLDGEMTILSSTDTIDPEVSISTDDTDNVLKAGTSVTIIATVTDANSIDGTPAITLSSGDVVNVPMTFVSENDWKYTWTAPLGDSNVTVSVVAYDAVGNDGTGTKILTIDNLAPTFIVDDGAAAGPVKTDTIKITLNEANGIAEAKYGFSIDNICDVNDSYAVAFVSGTSFDIAGDHIDYICAMAKDEAGNIGYNLIGKLNTDNTAPAAPVITLTDPVTAGNKTSVEIKGTGEADATMVWEIADENGVKVSGTGAIGSDGIISISVIDVTTLADGELTASVKLKDVAGNEGLNGTAKATKDVSAPTITKVSSDVVNGTYAVDKDIDIDVTFSEEVTGNVLVTFDFGKSCAFDVTDSTTGTCTYKVVAGDNTNHLTTTLSGSLVDDAGNAMAVFTPAFDKDIVIDTAAPTGYSVNIDQTSINSSNDDKLSFTFSGAEVGATYLFSLDNLDDIAASIIGTARTVTDASQQIEDIDISSLADGTITLWFSLKDTVGNEGIVLTDTVVKDTTGPIITVPADIVAEATSAAGAVVDYTVSATEGATVICAPASGSTFPIGDTIVTCNATDTVGNPAIPASFKITVRDTTAPVFSDVFGLATEAASPQGTEVYFSSMKATDIVDGDVAIICNPASGTKFSIGNTTVNCSATDAAMNKAETTFTVTVTDTIAPKIVNLAPVNLSTTSTGTPTISAEFEEAGSGIDVSSIVLSLAEYADANAFAVKTATGVSYTPSVPLEDGTYHATVTVSDIAGHSASQSWIFVINKAVTSVSVSTSATSVVANGTNSATITATVLNNGIPAVGATVNFASTIGTFSNITTTNAQGQATAILKSTVAGTTLITATYNSGDGIVQGTNDTLKFTAADTAAPTASSVPGDGATGVVVNVSPVITFNEAMDLSTLIDANIQLRDYASNAIIPANLEVSTNAKVVTINPISDLDMNKQYYIYIDGPKDVVGNEMISWIKDKHEFTTVAPHVSVVEYVISLQQGWNLISLPLVPTDKSMNSILAGTTVADVRAIQYYDAATGKWISYSPATGSGDLTTMEDGKGYWIDMKQNGTLTISGTESPKAPASPSKYKIVGGEWNMIGFTSVAQKSVGQYISQMGDNDRILAVDANGFYVSLTKDSLLNPGKGYWYYTPNAAGLHITQ